MKIAVTEKYPPCEETPLGEQFLKEMGTLKNKVILSVFLIYIKLIDVKYPPCEETPLGEQFFKEMRTLKKLKIKVIIFIQ